MEALTQRVVMCPAAVASNLSRECKHLLRLAKRRGKAKERETERRPMMMIKAADLQRP